MIRTTPEDFVEDPDRHLRDLCRTLGLPFDPGYRERWQAYDKLTGDSAGPSRGFSLEEIGALPARPLDASVLAALKDELGYGESLTLLGYDDREA